MVIYCCSDLIFATKIRSTSDALGIPSRAVQNLQALANRLNQVDDGRLNEPTSVILIDLELGAKALDMLRQIKAHDTKMPVVAFGSHVATAVLESARALGADHVMPRSQFTAQLPALIGRLGSPREPGSNR